MLPSSTNIPTSRRLRVYAYDPSLERVDTAGILETVVRVPWERLQPGPVGEYIEVVDVDPASNVAYPPVDLDDPNLLAQDGLPPSEGNPQFHQQMVYAVAMTTIVHFERALGRVALWTPRRASDKATGEWTTEFVRRLRIYPHALRDQNAYYSPEKRALLFGYFPVRVKDARNTPGTTVFACLSHDIVAHEVTHALLDGVHPRFNEPSNPDVHAFHEAFADIVALFQHFSYPGILRDQIAKTRGNLKGESVLGELAQQFGQATGGRGALRSYLGSPDEATGQWRLRPPDPRALEETTEPHERGAILVAAVFGAFLLVYESRTADLFRIATGGTGKLPEGDIHPDLARRLADEAGRCARDLLQMCIRALDYCPPVNITFGEYLRGVITADVNLNPGDESGYRLALVESFRAWGIYPRRIRSMSTEALVWPSGAEVIADTKIHAVAETKARATESAGETARAPPSRKEVVEAQQSSRKDIADLFKVSSDGAGGDATRKAGKASPTDGGAEIPQLHKWDLGSNRFEVWKNMEDSRAAFWRWLMLGKGREYATAFGLVLDKDAPKTVYRNNYGEPTVEVHSVRTALRRDARGTIVTDLVVEVTQRRRGYFTREQQEQADARPEPFRPREPDGDFKFRSGCTIVIDTTNNEFRHIIRTPGTITDELELDRVRAFLTGEAEPDSNAFDGMRQRSLAEPRLKGLNEPFALLHRSMED